jgi:molecular chaperone GrpE
MSTKKDADQTDMANAADADMAETTVLPEDYGVEAGAADEQAGEGDSLETALAKAEAAAEENWNKYLITVAELENVRKRAARDLEKARLFGVEGLAGELLSVADSLEMALETGSQAPAETLLEGGRATLKQLQVAMEKYGVTVISPEGEPFNPELHEAMSMQESATAEPDSVLFVVQRGYQLNGRLLRPARVIVAKEPAR